MYVYKPLNFAADCYALAAEFPALTSRLENLVALAFKSTDRRFIEDLEKIESVHQLPMVAALSKLGIDHDVTEPIRSLIMEVMGTAPAVHTSLNPLPSEIEIASGISRNGFKTGVEPNKIQAIKLYRERTGLGLKEGKEAVESALINRFGCHDPESLKRLAVSYTN